MGFFTGAYATVWRVEDKEKYTKVILSTSRKNKETGEYETDFNDYVNFVGEAHQMAKSLKPRDRIRLGNVSCTNWYNKEKDKKYYTFTVFSYEFVSSYDSGSGAAQQPAATSQSAAQSVADDDPF